VNKQGNKAACKCSYADNLCIHF